MALDLGLILGSALAGAAAGGGEAAQASLASAQDAQQKQDLVKMQSDLDEQKQLRIQEAEHSFQNQYQQNAFGHEDTTLANTQAFTGSQNALQRASEQSISAANNLTSVQVAGISAAASKYDADTRAAAEKAALAASRRGSSIITDSNGNMLNVTNQPDGPPTVTPIMDPTDPTKPLKSTKDVSAGQTALSAAFIGQAKAAEAQGDTKSAADFYAKAAAVITNGVSAGAPTMPAPSAKAIAQLKANPSMQPQFDAQFGAGASDKVLGGAAPAVPVTATTTPLPGGADPGAGTNNPALVNGQIPTQPSPPSGYPAAAPNRSVPVQPQPSNPQPAPYQPSALIATAMQPQTGAPPTQPAFKQQVDAFGRPIPQAPGTNLGL